MKEWQSDRAGEGDLAAFLDLVGALLASSTE